MYVCIAKQVIHIYLRASPSPPLDNIRVIMFVWSLRGNNCSVLGCVTQCSQSVAHLYEQFLQVQQIWFVTFGPLHYA